MPYGYELLLDLKDCNAETFTRASIDEYFTELCAAIGMRKCRVHFWDDIGLPPEEHETEPHAKGTSAVCFILTSSIVVHALDMLGAVYVNIFSCKSFDREAAERFTSAWFQGRLDRSTFIERI
jgi:S-adenosylmethionine decarboxylase